MAAKTKRSWREKLADSKDFPKVANIDCTKTKRWGEGTFVIPAPLEVDALMKTVRRGKLTTIDAIRKVLAKKHGTTIACPMTTGIFAWIAAHAADEAEHEGRSRVTPYWRTLKAGGELRFASDNGDYAGEALLTILANGAFAWTAERAKDWQERPSDCPETRYERKALSAGAKPAYLSFRRL